MGTKSMGFLLMFLGLLYLDGLPLSMARRRPRIRQYDFVVRAILLHLQSTILRFVFELFDFPLKQKLELSFMDGLI